jgi:hypothetical protein
LHQVIRCNPSDVEKKDQFLLENGANPHIYNEMINHALFLAIKQNLVPIDQLLLDSGANPNQPNENETTPLLLSAEDDENFDVDIFEACWNMEQMSASLNLRPAGTFLMYMRGMEAKPQFWNIYSKVVPKIFSIDVSAKVVLLDS